MDSFQSHMTILGCGIVVGLIGLGITEIDKRKKKVGERERNMNETLIAEFNRDMALVLEKSTEIGWNTSGFRLMLLNRGGVDTGGYQTAKDLLADPLREFPPDTFIRPELCAEYLVLLPRYWDLFDPFERATARRRLGFKEVK